MLDTPIPFSSNQAVKSSKNLRFAFFPRCLKQKSNTNKGDKAIKIHKYKILIKAIIHRRIIAIA